MLAITTTFDERDKVMHKFLLSCIAVMIFCFMVSVPAIAETGDAQAEVSVLSSDIKPRVSLVSFDARDAKQQKSVSDGMYADVVCDNACAAAKVVCLNVSRFSDQARAGMDYKRLCDNDERTCMLLCNAMHHSSLMQLMDGK